MTNHAKIVLGFIFFIELFTPVIAKEEFQMSPSFQKYMLSGRERFQEIIKNLKKNKGSTIIDQRKGTLISIITSGVGIKLNGSGEECYHDWGKEARYNTYQRSCPRVSPTPIFNLNYKILNAAYNQFPIAYKNVGTYIQRHYNNQAVSLFQGTYHNSPSSIIFVGFTIAKDKEVVLLFEGRTRQGDNTIEQSECSVKYNWLKGNLKVSFKRKERVTGVKCKFSPW